MAGELNIQDEGFARELLDLPAPLAFIDFEAFMPATPGVIPGTMPTDTIPCQWSVHTLYEHGIDWEGKLYHQDYLWTGDVGWNPIYSFTQTLYEATEDANTILIYTEYEIRCLNICKQLAQNDMDRMAVNDILEGYYIMDVESEELIPLALKYDILYDWVENQDFEFYVYDENATPIEIREISNLLDEWVRQNPLPYDYVVVNGYGEKVPVMEIAPLIAGWCDSMLSRFYDMCYGHITGGKELRDGGVKYWLQSEEFHNSNSIKHVMPAAMKEYSRTEELLISEGEPVDGYAGLRAMGNIAKGDECQSYYLRALNRPLRENVGSKVNGAAPFDMDIHDQCLLYCKLDTLSMVIIYLAVIEATENWNELASLDLAEFVRFDDDGLMHSIIVDADNKTVYKCCDEIHEYDYDTEFEVFSETAYQNMPIREIYAITCPKCRRIRTQAARR